MALRLVTCQQRHDGRNCNYEDTQSKVQHYDTHWRDQLFTADLQPNVSNTAEDVFCNTFSTDAWEYHKDFLLPSSIPSGKDSLQMLWLIRRQIWHHVLRPMCIYHYNEWSAVLQAHRKQYKVRCSHWLNTKSFARLAAWLLSGHTVFVKPQPPNRKNAAHLQIDGSDVFPGTLRRPKKRPILRTLEQIYEQCSCPANEVLWEGK